MKKLKSFNMLCILTILTLTISCSSEDSETLISEEPILTTNEVITLNFNYKGVQYPIDISIEANGDFTYLDEIPAALEKIQEIETLATVVSGDQIYLFDNQAASDRFFENKYGVPQVRQSAAGGTNFSVSRFNRDVRAFEHDFFTGRKLNITQGYQLRNLAMINFNDVMSSIGIDTQYQNPFVGDRVILYEHKDFGGKSLSFICELETSTCRFISGGTSSNLISTQVYRGNQKFRNISFGLFRRWADKVSSIDVRFGTVSVVPPYPSSGGGGSGGGGIDVFDDIPIK